MTVVRSGGPDKFENGLSRDEMKQKVSGPAATAIVVVVAVVVIIGGYMMFIKDSPGETPEEGLKAMQQGMQQQYGNKGASTGSGPSFMGGGGPGGGSGGGMGGSGGGTGGPGGGMGGPGSGGMMGSGG
jgi:hypothetical protein